MRAAPVRGPLHGRPADGRALLQPLEPPPPCRVQHTACPATHRPPPLPLLPATSAGGKGGGFRADLSDPRFAQLLTSHHFALDPTDPRFK